MGRNVILGAGAKVLGDIVVGDGARVGANAVVVADVQPGRPWSASRPARWSATAPQPAPAPAFLAYGTPCDGAPDPLMCQIEVLRAELLAVEARVAAMARARRPTPAAE